MTFKGQIKVIEFLMGCIFWMVHVMTKFCMKHINIHVYGLSVNLMIFELDDLWPWMTFKDEIGNYGGDFEQYFNKFHFW